MQTIEQLIQEKAYELGYEKCGIIPIHMLDGYAEKLEERTQKVPESKIFYRGQRRLAEPLAAFPWAKSVVVMAMPYGRYRIPEAVRERIGKTYLFDVRVDANTKEYQNSRTMERYMQELGLQVASNSKFGLVGLRWAAKQAGLGLIRRNNFFYTGSGSWIHLEAWLTDREMELRETPDDIRQCPEKCNLCIKACPTKSLSAPYTMSPTACVSFLTTFGGRDLPREPLSKSFGSCIYGCDICQDVCPMNKGKWQEQEEFPGLAELIPALTPEKILDMEEDFYRAEIQPKFFYLTPEERWKWKVNALRFMGNNYQAHYKPYILKACENENEKIREMAQTVLEELGQSLT